MSAQLQHAACQELHAARRHVPACRKGKFAQLVRPESALFPALSPLWGNTFPLCTKAMYMPGEALSLQVLIVGKLKFVEC